MKIQNLHKSLLASVVLVLVSSAIFAVPAKAAADDSLTPMDGICDFASASLGHGSAADPFLIGTPKQLAEMSDCSNRIAQITAAVGDGTSITYDAENSFGIGQVLYVSGNDPSSFNIDGARVIAATSSSFTIKSAVTDASVGGGTATDTQTFYSIVADIDLSTGNESWNNVDTSIITNATGDGSTITYTGANTFEPGQSVVIKNIDPIEYSVGDTTIVSATATEFTVSGSASSTYITGGVANSNGWAPIVNTNTNGGPFRNSLVIGNGHTISGLTIHRSQSNVGLFGRAENVSMSDLILANIDVDASGLSGNSHTAGLIGNANFVNLTKISVQGNVTGSSSNVGVLVGEATSSVFADIETAGSIKIQRIGTFENNTKFYSIAGVVGNFSGSAENVHSSAEVIAVMTNNVNDSVAYGESVGGLFGYINGNLVNSSASGAVIGGAGVGGLAGNSGSGGIAGSHATGNVTAHSAGNSAVRQVGGLLGGFNCCGAISDSYATGDVTAYILSPSAQSYHIGGFLGNNDCCAAIVGSYSTGNVTVTTTSSYATFSIGGFVGNSECCSIYQNVYATGDVTVNNGHKVGGLMGASAGARTAILDSYATGNVSVGFDGEAEVGGLVGFVHEDIMVSRSYATGNVNVTPFTEGESARNVGGLIGHTRLGPIKVQDSFYAGSVTGSEYVAGLIGHISNNLVTTKNVYVAASVTATLNRFNDPVANGGWSEIDPSNFFDTTAAATSTSVSNFSGKTTAELLTKETFTNLGWNFATENGIWKIAADVNGGFPTLVGKINVEPGDGDGGTTPEVIEKTVSLSSKNGVLTLSKLTKFKVRTYAVNMPNTFAKKQITVHVLRDGLVVKVLKRAKLNKGGNITFTSKFALTKGDVVQIKDAKKVRANVAIS